MDVPAATPATSFDQILASLQAKFPDAEVEAYSYSGGKFILRTPDEGACSIFMAAQNDKKLQVQNTTAFCKRGVLYPDVVALDALFTKKPLLCLRIGDTLLAKAGAAEEIAAVK